MKKSRPKSSGKSGKGISGRKTGSAGTGGKIGKKSFFGSGYRAKKRKAPGSGFRKPEHDPGPKVREQEPEILEDYAEGYPPEEQTSGLRGALQGTGCGCCGSIAALVWLIVLGTLAALFVLVVKCAGC